MSLHSSKRTALVQLINCMPSCVVETIEQLSDGQLFCDIIKTVFPETQFGQLTQERQNNVSCKEQSKDEKVCGGFNIEPEDDKMIVEDSKVESEEVIKKDSETIQESVIEVAKSAVTDSECTIIPTKPPGECIVEPTESVNGDSESVAPVSVIEQPKSSETVTESVNGNSESVAPVSVIEQPKSSGSISESLTQPPKSLDCDSKSVVMPLRFSDDISKRYSLIQYFIDVKYEIKTETMISVSGCRNANELELAKVTIFILSEVVRYYVHMNDAVIHTLSHLDIKVQQDLEQCFNFFINDRSNITEENVHKILSNHAPYKISSSPSRSVNATPRRTCRSKYRRSPSPAPSPSQESVYADSPLKTYFESPVFTKADIISKEKEIFKTRQILYEEESKCYNLQKKIEDLESVLKAKEKDLNDLKVTNRILQNDEKSEECEDCKVKQKIVDEQKKCLQFMEDDVKKNNNGTSKQFDKIFLDYQMQVEKKFASLKLMAYNAEEKYNNLETELQEKTVKIYNLERNIEVLKEQRKEVVKELEIYKEKLSDAKKDSKEPESPVGDKEEEYMGDKKNEMLQEENEKLQEENEKLQEKNEKSQEKNEKLEKENKELCNEIVQLKLKMDPEREDVMVQFPEQHIDYSGENESNVSVPGLLPSADLPEDKKFHNVKNFEDVNEECSDMCDVSSKLDTTSNYSAGSSSIESPHAENMCTPVKNDVFGSLWLKENDSPPENKSADKVFLIGNTKRNETIKDLEKTISFLSNMIRDPNYLHGSNGLKPENIVEDLTSIKQFLECLMPAENEGKFRNNDSDSKAIMTEESDNRNSEIAAMKQKHDDEIQKKQEEIESLERIHEGLSKKLKNKDTKLDSCREKYYVLKNDWNIRGIKCKELELKCQKLGMELKDVKRGERDIRNKEMNSLHMKHLSAYKHLAELRENLKSCRNELQKVKDENIELNKTKKEVEEDKKKFEEKKKLLEQKLEGANVHLKALSTTTTENNLLPFIKGLEDVHALIKNSDDGFSKSEFISLSSNEVTSFNTGNESILSGALYSRRFYGDFPLVTDDEEGFLNYSNIPEIINESSGIQESERRQELRRRNTLCPSHMQSTYATEGIFLTPADKKLPNSNKYKNSVFANQSDINGRIQKKRKRSEYEPEKQSNMCITSVGKGKRSRAPSPFKIFWPKNRRSEIIKPKP